MERSLITVSIKVQTKIVRRARFIGMMISSISFKLFRNGPFPARHSIRLLELL